MRHQESAGSGSKGLKVSHVSTVGDPKRSSNVAPGFWRGGQHFSDEPRTVALSDLTPEQAAAIRAEGQAGGRLRVEEVETQPTEP